MGCGARPGYVAAKCSESPGHGPPGACQQQRERGSFPGQVHPHTGTARGVAASGGKASPRGPFSQGLPKGLRAALSLYGFTSPEGIPSVSSKSLRAKPRRGKELAFSSVRNTGGPVCA